MSIIVITGMHRSGTSMIASYLNYCGLDIGEDLIGASRGNTKGHFEDRNFVQFHRHILERSGQGTFLAKYIETNRNDKESANQLIQRRSRSEIWGWKDPRTVLFLDFWHGLMGARAKYIFLYRDPGQVIDSLLRRNTDKVLRRKPAIAAKSWIHYNREILRFLSTTDACCALYNYDDVLKQPDKIIEFVNHNESRNLSVNKIQDIYDPDLLSRSISLMRSNILCHLYKKKFTEIYKELERVSDTF